MSIVFFPELQHLQELCRRQVCSCNRRGIQTGLIQWSGGSVELLLRCLCILVCQHITVYQLERLTCFLRNAPSWKYAAFHQAGLVVNRQHNGSPACAHFTEILCLCMLCCVRPSLAIKVLVLPGSFAGKLTTRMCMSSSCPSCHYCHTNKPILTACPTVCETQFALGPGLAWFAVQHHAKSALTVGLTVPS